MGMGSHRSGCSNRKEKAAGAVAASGGEQQASDPGGEHRGHN